MSQVSIVEQDKEIVRHAIEQDWNKGNLTVIDELYDPNSVFHQESGDAIPGIANFKEWITVIDTAFPDIRATSEAYLPLANRLN